MHTNTHSNCCDTQKHNTNGACCENVFDSYYYYNCERRAAKRPQYQNKSYIRCVFCLCFDGCKISLKVSIVV